MAAMAAEFLVVDLQLLPASAALTLPIVAVEHLLAQFLILLSIQNDSWCLLTAGRALYAHSRAS